MAPSLPNELWLKIFGYLPTCDKAKSLTRVNHHFHALLGATTIAKLTPSIWTNILSNLNYYDLKLHIRRVCQVLKHIVDNHDHPVLAAKLFRERVATAPTIDKNTRIQVHPTFDSIRNECYTNIKDVGFWGDKDYPLSDCYCAHENATSPPTTRLILTFGNAPKRTFTTRRRASPPAITVLDVMELACKIMGLKPKIWEVDPFWMEQMGYELDELTFSMLQGDHTGYNGFDDVKGQDDGTVVIKTRYFDS